jgi:hypothetical protein
MATIAAIAPALASSCTTVAGITNARDATCGQSIELSVAAILIDQEEQPTIAVALGRRTRQALGTDVLGPKPFTLASPSGKEYGFVVELDDGACVLHLTSVKKGDTSTTARLSSIAERPLDGCACKA